MSPMEGIIERVFFRLYLRIFMVGVLILLLFEVVFLNARHLYVIIESFMVSGALLAMVGYKRNLFLAVILFSLALLLSVCFLSVYVQGYVTGINMALLLLLGFTNAVLLNGRKRFFLVTLTILVSIVLFMTRGIREGYPGIGAPSGVLALQAGVTIAFLIIFGCITYTAAVLKDSFDESQKKLYTHNEDLKVMLLEREERLLAKKRDLIKLSFSTAHNIRGPLARILGLIGLAEIEDERSKPLYFSMIKDQAQQLDNVIKEVAKEINESIEDTDENELKFPDNSNEEIGS